MAKKDPDPSDPPENDEELIAALRRAVDAQPHRLQGEPEDGALFADGKRGAALLALALERGYVLELPLAEGIKKNKKNRQGKLSEKGQRHLAELDSPRRLLEALLPVVTRLAAKLEDSADALREVLHVLEGALLAPQEVPLPTEGAAEEDEESREAESPLTEARPFDHR